jgi:hypothetical protein
MHTEFWWGNLLGNSQWVGHLVPTGKTNAFRNFVRKSLGIRPLRRCMRRWEDNIKIDV